jgi:hypothetical protein
VKIHELLDHDPRTGRLANNGQARITDAADDRARAELRAELETFVCDGQFGDALQRIIGRYLDNLNAARQDSAWVSGFFGSGKSHLLKMLTHFWVNTPFEDGSTARTLVRAGLPEELQAQLRELDTHARRTGKPAVAAAGSMLGGNVDHVRATVLSILLRGCGWPDQYPQAMFCFWLREQGWLDEVRSSVERAGRHWLKELNSLHVSPVIARSLIQANPDFAADEKSARQVLVRQFPLLTTDISTAQFVEAGRKALSPDGELPVTVLVLDEVQQYINEAADRAAAITEVAEAVQTQFDSRVLFVGAGQSALSAGTHALGWLRDRFRVTVELNDADVEAVTRKVLLAKKPSATQAVDAMFEAHSGEVARHLQGTRLAQRVEDRRDRTLDYPLLPVRRRFWEACFQAVDAAGTHSQLRSQLRILHDSLRDVADRDLGAAIPASDLFTALSASLVNTRVLLNEINTRIQKLDDGTEDGRLRRDLCGLVFLIGKLPRQDGVDVGVRADAVSLADLLVIDLAKDTGPFRKRVADALNALADDGIVMRVAGEYRLQTTVSAEWDVEFRHRHEALRDNELEISARRDQLFGQALQAILAATKIKQGESKVPRAVALYTRSEPPTTGGDHVMVWLRDEWSTSRKDVERRARQMAQEDPTLHVFLPKSGGDALRERIVEVEAARQTLDHYGVPSSEEGREARESMESRRRGAEAERDRVLRDILRASHVYQGGGSEIFGEELAQKIAAGAEASLARLFPRFPEGDHRAWESALKRAKDGADQPFKVVGWDGATEEHPVAREVLGKVAAGARGTDLHKSLKAAPYGWPQDAIDAALIALHRSGHLRATRNGQLVAPSALDQAGIRGAEFRPERVRIETRQRITLRGLFETVGVSTRSGEEELRAPAFLDAVLALAARAGGGPPMPAQSDTRSIDDLKRLTGAEQLAAILQRKDELEASIDAWTELADRAEARRAQWDLAAALRRHAEGLAVGVEAGGEVDAIRAQRSLLDGADHVAPLVAKLAAALRAELTAAHAALAESIVAARAMLDADETWRLVPEAGRESVLREAGLESPAELDIGSNQALLKTLEARSLASWRDLKDAIPQRIARALEHAAAVAGRDDPTGRATTTITVRRGTLADEAAVRAWLQEHETKLSEAVQKGPVIVG